MPGLSHEPGQDEGPGKGPDSEGRGEVGGGGGGGATPAKWVVAGRGSLGDSAVGWRWKWYKIRDFVTRI